MIDLSVKVSKLSLSYYLDWLLSFLQIRKNLKSQIKLILTLCCLFIINSRPIIVIAINDNDDDITSLLLS